jgi:uncharacterized membrane protein
MKMKNKIIQLAFLGILFSLLEGCYYDNEQALYHLTAVDCSKINSTYKNDVTPIITNHCSTPSCHNSTGAGGVILLTYDQAYAKLDRIKQRVLVDKTMPPNGALNTAELNIIQCWINAGAPNN